MKIISIFDKKAETYSNPSILPNIALLDRFIKITVPEDSVIRKFADDYDVAMLGEFDEKTGKIVQSDVEPMIILELGKFFKEVEK